MNRISNRHIGLEALEEYDLKTTAQIHSQLVYRGVFPLRTLPRRSTSLHRKSVTEVP